jgi:phage shock protein C
MNLVRSTSDKYLFGVCGGIADQFGVSSTLVRVGLVVLSLFTFSVPVAVYIALGLVLPKDDRY